MTKPLIVISSRTGNTRLLGHAICDAVKDAVMVDAKDLPEDLSEYNPILLGFWCDRGRAPEEMLALAPRFHGKRIACFATMGGDPEHAKWMDEACRELVEAGSGNVLVDKFLCRGRIDPEVFDRMTKKFGDEFLALREERRLAAETHPDRLDLAKAADLFRGIFGGSW